MKRILISVIAAFVAVLSVSTAAQADVQMQNQSFARIVAHSTKTVVIGVDGLREVYRPQANGNVIYTYDRPASVDASGNVCVAQHGRRVMVGGVGVTARLSSIVASNRRVTVVDAKTGIPGTFLGPNQTYTSKCNA